MNDEMLLNNYLLLLKSTTEVYVHGTLESSNEDVREVLHDYLHETLSNQAKVYTLMSQNGFYNETNVESNIISQTLNKLKSGS